MAEINKNFRVKNGLEVGGNGTFDGTVAIATPTENNHAATKLYVDQNEPDSFSTIAVSGQDSVVADSSADTLTLVAGSNITITTNAASDSITISAASGGITTGKAIAIAMIFG